MGWGRLHAEIRKRIPGYEDHVNYSEFYFPTSEGGADKRSRRWPAEWDKRKLREFVHALNGLLPDDENIRKECAFIEESEHFTFLVATRSNIWRLGLGDVEFEVRTHVTAWMAPDV